MKAIISRFTSIFGLLVCLLSPSLFAQDISSHHRCGHDEIMNINAQENPRLRDINAYRSWVEQQMRQSRPFQRSVITIPVIVHVIHDGEEIGVGHNLSQVQIQSQIDVLNEDFRRKTGTNGENSNPDGADVEIEFCLAIVDTNGNYLPEPGIHRVDRNQRGYTSPPYTFTYHQNTIQADTYWDPDSYLNIWVSRLANNFLGFTILPGDSALDPHKDGVVITNTAFGRVGNLTSPYDQGRTLTHELGHWLGLLHTWGQSGGCSDDDGCEDTPPTDSPNNSCDTAIVKCGTQDMVENYMEYTPDICMNTFTKCQKQIMRAVMSNTIRRTSLLNSTVCQGVSFTATTRTACEGSQVQFSDQSSFAPSSWAWSFPGGVPDTSNLPAPVVTYPNPGFYPVSLTITNSLGTSTRTQNNFVNILSSSKAVFYEQDFESGLGDWSISNPDDAETWELTPITGSRNGSFAVYLPYFVYPTRGSRDELISPIIDLGNFFDIDLKFDHAYRSFSTPSEDSLLILASTDGGGTWPHLLFGDAENGSSNFATNSESSVDFSPGSDEDWCYGGNSWSPCKTLDLNSFAGEKEFRIKFVGINGYGNNLFLDNIRLEGSCSASVANNLPSNPPSGEVTVFPNPTQGNLNLQLSSPEAVNVRLYNLLGESVRTWNFSQSEASNTIQLALDGVSKGTYLIRIEGKQTRSLKKVIKW